MKPTKVSIVTTEYTRYLENIKGSMEVAVG